MFATQQLPIVLTVAVAASLPGSMAAAQPIDSVGIRATAMGGAFVAVADDATAVYWNPAGLAKGAFVSFVAEWLEGDLDPDPDPDVADTSRRSGTLFAIAVPSFGFSYYRLNMARAPAADAAVPSSRNDTGTGAPIASSLTTDHTGVTILQSLGDSFVVGATLRWVRGVARSGPVDATADNAGRLEAARNLPGRSGDAFDLDAGVLAVFGPVRVGLVTRNLRQARFEAPDGTELRLEQQVRAGVAVRPHESLLVSADADLRTATDVDGERRRRLAFGGEGRLGRLLALRGGLSVALQGSPRSTTSAGASVALGPRWWLDGAITRGAHGERTWGVSARLDY